MSQAAYVAGSTGTSDTRRSARGTDGADGAAPRTVHRLNMNGASDTSPAKGENVSEVSPEANHLEESLVHEVSECRRLLRETTRRDLDDLDIDYVSVRVKEARARLEYLERHVEKANQ